jgi:hypothetical protein
MKTKADPRVVVVVDRDYGALLRLLPEEAPAWVVDTPVNHKVIVELWDSRKRWSQGGVLTSFIDKPALSPEELLISILDVVDLHHGSYSQDPPWSIAQIIGARALPHLIKAMETQGFRLQCQNRDGLEFRRRNPVQAEVDRL